MEQSRSRSVVRFAWFVAILIVLAAFFNIRRTGGIDEIGLFNPSYMLREYGKLTYPIHGYVNLPVIVHPPVHVGLIGLLARAGLSWYYAEPIPALCWMLIGIVVIVRGPFPPAVQFGFLFTYGYLILSDLYIMWFGTRPEGHVFSAWLAGLLLLEAGRLSGWKGRELFLGAFALTWASGVHYPAVLAFAGALLYAVWAVRSLGWKEARPRVVAIAAGGCLFGLPYAAFYLLPHLRQILYAIREGQAGGGVPVAIAMHMELYRSMAQATLLPSFLRFAFGLRVPLVVWSTAIFLCMRSTRGLALASLPLPLFLLLGATHKWGLYLIYETGLFTAALAAGMATLLSAAAERSPWPGPAGRTVRAGIALGFAVFIVQKGEAIRSIVVTTRPIIHEMEVARAANRDILGPNARVVSRLGAWYAAGGDHWHEHLYDLIGGEAKSYDPIQYLSNFDAAADYMHRSADNFNAEHNTLSRWYAEGTLKLKGFFLAEYNTELRIVLMSVTAPDQVRGYALRDGQLYRFDQFEDGDYTVLTAACPASAATNYFAFGERFPWSFFAILDVTPRGPGATAQVLTVMTPRRSAEPARSLRSACRIVSQVNGAMTIADKEAMVAELRRNDRPIHFYPNVAEIPGFKGTGLPEQVRMPSDTVRLARSASLGEAVKGHTDARLEHIPQLRLTTSPLPGAFGAAIPLRATARIRSQSWAFLRLNVVRGKVGFGTHNSRTGELVRMTGFLGPTGRPVEVALAVPDISRADSIVVFNENGYASSQVDIFEAGILVPKRDFERRKAELGRFR